VVKKTRVQDFGRQVKGRDIMKITASQLRSLIKETVETALERSPVRGLTRAELFGEYSDIYKSIYGVRYRNEEHFMDPKVPIADLEAMVEDLYDESMT